MYKRKTSKRDRTASIRITVYTAVQVPAYTRPPGNYRMYRNTPCSLAAKSNKRIGIDILGLLHVD